MTDPYRDENESLRAENARLKTALAKYRRRRRPLLAVAAVAVDFGLVIALRPFLNGDDLRFWLALGVLVLVPVVFVWIAIGGGASEA
ncbi:MAG: hypothetical protein U0235_09670 [Polyangiaceae bacterium]